MKTANSSQLKVVQPEAISPAELMTPSTDSPPADGDPAPPTLEKTPEFSVVPSGLQAAAKPKRRYSPRRTFEAAVRHMKKAMESHDRSGNMTFVNVEGSVVHQDARDLRGILRRRRRKQHLTIARIDMED